MSTRTLAVLALLAALALAGVWLTREPPPDAGREARAGEPFLPGLEARVNEVSGLRVRAAGGDLLAQVARRDGTWRVANRAGYPADTTTLRGTLIGLARARRLEPKTDRPQGHARLGVAPIEQAQGKAIEVALEGLERPAAVLIGKPSTGDVGGTYVRRVGAARAWLVSGELERHERVGDWLDDRLVDIPARAIRRVRIEAVDGAPVVVHHAEPGADGFELQVPEGRRPLSSSIARSLARVVTDLRLDDVQAAPEAAELPRLARARFETFSGLVLEIEAFARSRAEDAHHHVRLRAGTTDAAGAEARERAGRLNARYRGWVYRLPGYKLVNATQTLEGVLE
ncbi:MAG: DUF4340 domain-containing protein [Halofilum sp. (in: g-proteobacteria)]|nr:DUF4340 domain-containing protein [Halofilum sp. (in: g-proteobacteria)]